MKPKLEFKNIIVRPKQHGKTATAIGILRELTNQTRNRSLFVAPTLHHANIVTKQIDNVIPIPFKMLNHHLTGQRVDNIMIDDFDYIIKREIEELFYPISREGRLSKVVSIVLDQEFVTNLIE